MMQVDKDKLVTLAQEPLTGDDTPRGNTPQMEELLEIRTKIKDTTKELQSLQKQERDLLHSLKQPKTEAFTPESETTPQENSPPSPADGIVVEPITTACG